MTSTCTVKASIGSCGKHSGGMGGYQGLRRSGRCHRVQGLGPRLCGQVFRVPSDGVVEARTPNLAVINTALRTCSACRIGMLRRVPSVMSRNQAKGCQVSTSGMCSRSTWLQREVYSCTLWDGRGERGAEEDVRVWGREGTACARGACGSEDEGEWGEATVEGARVCRIRPIHSLLKFMFASSEEICKQFGATHLRAMEGATPLP